MQLALDIDAVKLAKAISSLPREEKIMIVENIERDLLTEWNEYENSKEVKKRVRESFDSYEKGEYVQLKDLL